MITSDELRRLKVVGHQYCGDFEDRPCPDVHSCGGLVYWGLSDELGAKSWSPREYPGSGRVITRYLGRWDPSSYWSGPILRAMEALRSFQ